MFVKWIGSSMDEHEVGILAISTKRIVAEEHFHGVG